MKILRTLILFVSLSHNVKLSIELMFDCFDDEFNKRTTSEMILCSVGSPTLSDVGLTESFLNTESLSGVLIFLVDCFNNQARDVFYPLFLLMVCKSKHTTLDTF